MKTSLTLLFFFLVASSVKAFDEEALREDVGLILSRAGWSSGGITFSMEAAEKNSVAVECHGDDFHLRVMGGPAEQVSALYHGLFKLGFLFPHPRWQISPELKE